MEGKKQRTERIIKRKTKEYFKNKMEQEGTSKSKVEYLIMKKGLNNQWPPGNRQKYMNTMTRKQASIIFKARTRMLDVKNNFRNKYKDTECRLCRVEKETQEHILMECSKLHQDESTKVNLDDIFSPNVTAETANKLMEIQETLDQWEKRNCTARQRIG